MSSAMVNHLDVYLSLLYGVTLVWDFCFVVGGILATVFMHALHAPGICG